MPKLIEKPLQEKRIALSLTQDINSKLCALARVEGLKPAVFARKILNDYFDAHASEVAEALEAEKVYQEKIKNIRDRRISLFDDKED
jgi:hypothetical protein